MINGTYYYSTMVMKSHNLFPIQLKAEKAVKSLIQNRKLQTRTFSLSDLLTIQAVGVCGKGHCAMGKKEKRRGVYQSHY